MSKKQAHFSHRRAFTLLELLLVLALVAISMAAVVPHLNGTLNQWQLREGVRNLETTLRLASQWARVKQEAVAFALDVQSRTFALRSLQDGPSANRTFPAVGRQSLGRGVEITRLEGLIDVGQEKVLVFWPDGTSEAATIVLTSGRTDSGQKTLWQIALDGRGTIRCQERLDDETSG